MRILAVLLALATPALAATRASDLAAAIRGAGLDPEKCYRVRDLSFTREDLRFYFTEGYLILGKPVAGRPVSAVFSGEVEGGDAELIVLPPTRDERQSLARFTGSPNLNEHFLGAVMLFTDDTAREIEETLRRRNAQAVPEAGLLLAASWDGVVRNLGDSFNIRLIEDLLGPDTAGAGQGFFYAAIRGRQFGNFDVQSDSTARDQIFVGQLVHRENRSFYDTWTSFACRSVRSGRRQRWTRDFRLDDFRIQATLEPTLRLNARAAIRLTPDRGGLHALGFDVSPRMRIASAKIDGVEAEVFQRESLRANLLRSSDNQSFLVVAPEPLAANRAHEIEFEYAGEPVSQAGRSVYYVGARGNWYPQRGLQFARFDLTFTYPATLELLFPGDLKEDRTDGPNRITRKITPSPIRMAGFNLGEFERVKTERGGYTIEVYANRRLEEALQPRARDLAILPLPQVPWRRPTQRTPDLVVVPPPPPPDPTARLDALVSEVAAAFEFLSAQFGPPPLKTLLVSPIPAMFGQGFPGLVYLSTLSYLDPQTRPLNLRDQTHRLFFTETLPAHETAHQWWGNLVTSASYQDDWLMEALASYSALMMLERRRGPRVMASVLEAYKSHLLDKDDQDRTRESVGPLGWGLRLRSSQAPEAWRTIVYEKGAWVIHMLRRRMGDERFLQMLGELIRRYRYREVSTETFRSLAAEFHPPRLPDPKLESFVENWILATGVPGLKLSRTVKGKAPNLKLTVTVTQSDVGEDFSAAVPVEIQVGRGRPIVEWVRTGGDPVTFTLSLRQPPLKVILDPHDSVLAVKK